MFTLHGESSGSRRYPVAVSRRGHATHIQGDGSVAEQAATKSPSSVDVLWVDLFKQRLLEARTDGELQKNFSFPFKDYKQEQSTPYSSTEHC